MVTTALNLASASPDWAPTIDPNGIQSIERDPADIDEPRLQQLFDHWNTARGDAPWLRYADLRPELCPRILPHLALIERRPNRQPSLYIRLTGEEISNRTLGFAKGRVGEDLRPNWYRDHLIATYCGAFADGEAHFSVNARGLQLQRGALPARHPALEPLWPFAGPAADRHAAHPPARRLHLRRPRSPLNGVPGTLFAAR